MKNFVISVKGKTERRDHILNEFNRHNIGFEFFNAVTPRDNTALLSRFKLDIDTELSNLEISCFLSHYMIWKKVVEERISYVGVFEDDIYLGNKASFYLSNADWIPEGAHIVKLEKGWQDSIRVRIPSIKKGTRRLYKLRSEHFGTAGYILTYAGAQFLLKKYSDLNRLLPIDVLVFGVFLSDKNYKAWQILPALCIQDFLLNPSTNVLYSELEGSRSLYQSNNRTIKQKNIFFKLKREICRPFIQLKNFIFMRKSKYH